MEFSFPRRSKQAAIHYMAFNNFGIPYQLYLAEGKDGEKDYLIVFELQDDLFTPQLQYDLGKTVGLLAVRFEQLLEENIWPIPLAI